MEIFGTIAGHYFSDCGNGLDGSESCFSIQSESFSGDWLDNGHCALCIPDASDGSKSCHARPPGLGQEIRDSSKNSLADGLACQETLRPWSESIGDWSMLFLTIQTTNLADKSEVSTR